MFPGPGQWLTHKDAWQLKESFALPKSAQSLQDTIRAAQFRVATLGCQLGRNNLKPHHLLRPPEDNIMARAFNLRHCLANTDYDLRMGMWQEWYNGCYCKVLSDNLQHLHLSCDITPQGVIQRICPTPLHQWDDKMLAKVKRGMQSMCVKAIKETVVLDPVERIRHKTSRWRDKPYGLTGLPGIQVPIIHRHIRELAKLVAPRVHAATFKTLWNGWTTERRFQRRWGASNICRFMCSDTAEDSIEHYCRCPIVLRVAHSILHIHYPNEQALNVWMLNNHWIDNPEVMTCVAILIYGTFNAFNSIQHNGISCSQQAYVCIVQHCRQGVMSHPASTRVLENCWQRRLLALC